MGRQKILYVILSILEFELLLNFFIVCDFALWMSCRSVLMSRYVGEFCVVILLYIPLMKDETRAFLSVYLQTNLLK